MLSKTYEIAFQILLIVFIERQCLIISSGEFLIHPSIHSKQINGILMSLVYSFIFHSSIRSNMAEVPFIMVKGHRRNALLLFAYEDRHLYVRKYRRNGKEEFVCYQSILRKSDTCAKACAAGVIFQNSICSRKKIKHSRHEHHQSIYDDLVTRSRIIDRCISLKDAREGLVFSVPAQDIFTLEMSQLVNFLHFLIPCLPISDSTFCFIRYC